MRKKSIKQIMSLASHVNSNVTVDKAITYMLSKETEAILIKNGQGNYIGISIRADLIKLLEKDLNPSTLNVYSVMPSLIQSPDQTES